MNRYLSTSMLVLAGLVFAFTASAQTRVGSTDPLRAPDAPTAERSNVPIVYWMLIDTSGSMTEERVRRARDTYFETERVLRDGIDQLRAFVFPHDNFAHCTRNAPRSQYTGLPRPDGAGERPIERISRSDVEAMRHGYRQSQTTPLWPAVAELLHEVRAAIDAGGTGYRHRMIVVTDRGCDQRHCTRRRPAPDLDDLDCDDITEDAIRALLPSMASENLLGSGVNQISWTLVDQAAAGAPGSSLCTSGVNCAADVATNDTLIPPWRFGDVDVTVPDGTRYGLASREIPFSLRWSVEQVGLDEMRASARFPEDGPFLASAASHYIGVDAGDGVELSAPAAMNPAATAERRPERISSQITLAFGSAEPSINRAERPERVVPISLPTEYVTVPLAASEGRILQVPAGGRVVEDITADVLPLLEYLGVTLDELADRLEIGAIAYGRAVERFGLEAALLRDQLANGRLLLELRVVEGRGDEPAWHSSARIPATEFVEANPNSMALVLRDTNDWFVLTPLAVSQYICESPCDSNDTCTEACDRNCCVVQAQAPGGFPWWLLVLLAVILGIVGFVLWSRRYPDPRGLRLRFTSSQGEREVRVFGSLNYSPWSEPRAVVSPEALESEATLYARCTREGDVEVKLRPEGTLRAGSRAPGTTVLLAKVKGGVKHAADLELVDEGRVYEVIYNDADKKA